MKNKVSIKKVITLLFISIIVVSCSNKEKEVKEEVKIEKH